MTRAELKYRLALAKHKLLETGWEEICSMMTDTPEDGKFGTLFMKKGERVWLNVKTVDLFLTEDEKGE